MYHDSAPNTFYDKTLKNKLVLKYLNKNKYLFIQSGD